MNPVFLIGAERSGTTLLRLMLDEHPLISWLEEFEYAVDFVSSDNWPDINSYVKWLETHRIFLSAGFSVNSSLDYPSLVKSFLAQKQEQDKKPIIGATCHRHYDRLIEIFPQARFIYLLRDPRDVARSNIGMGWAGNVWKGVDKWIGAEKLWAKVKGKIGKNTFIEIRYEELVVSPESTLKAICHFLDVDYDSKMISYDLHSTYLKPDPKLIEQWKRKMSKREIALVEYKTIEIMEKRSYNLHSNRLDKPSLIEKSIFTIQDKFYRIKFRVKRYGFRLYITELLARKLDFTKFASILKLRMNEIDTRYLK
jgi:hypothetical protein